MKFEKFTAIKERKWLYIVTVTIFKEHLIVTVTKLKF